MGIGGHLWRGCLTGADRPYRLIGNDKFGGFLGRDSVESSQTLPAKNVVSEPGFPFLEHLSDTNDWCETSLEG